MFLFSIDQLNLSVWMNWSCIERCVDQDQLAIFFFGEKLRNRAGFVCIYNSQVGHAIWTDGSWVCVHYTINYIANIYIYDTTSIHVNQRAEIRLWSQSLLLVCDATKQASKRRRGRIGFGLGWIGLDNFSNSASQKYSTLYQL